MAGPLPVGLKAPADGLIPISERSHERNADFGVYIHVPFCRVRCGYCDFNTYTSTELSGARQSDYANEAIHELRFGASALSQSGFDVRPVATVFFGGGTPTLLPVTDLSRMLNGVRQEFGLVDGAEITTEANPDSVDQSYLDALAAAGFTRISFGVQSAVSSTLSTLDRTHNPRSVPEVVSAARRAGLDVSLDLIYGSPGETLSDWAESVEFALGQNPDHISAYALIVEDGTKLARQIRSGLLVAPDDDLQADMYALADESFMAAGFDWYEISNWARTDAHRSRHNLAYWTGSNWWGVGPGAHSHIEGTRWWNVKHPAAYASRIAQGISPAHAREYIDEQTSTTETILLRSRIRDGLPISVLSARARKHVSGLIGTGLIDGSAALSGVIVLTRTGRLLADTIVHKLVD